MAWAVWVGVISSMPFLFCSLFVLFIAPKFREIFHALGSENSLPLITVLLLKASDTARRLWPLFVLLMFALWVATFRYLRKGRSRVGRRMAWTVCWLPFVLLIVLVVWTLVFTPVIVDSF